MREPRSRGGGQEDPHLARGRPRWPVATTLMILWVTYTTLLEDLLPGPSFVPIVLVAVLFVPLLYAELRGHYHLSRFLGLGLVTLATIAIGVIVLNFAAPLDIRDKPPQSVLLSQAFLISTANILTFAIWYWEIDNGGPERRQRDTYQSEDFLFPQMGQDQGDSANWSPGLIDYLFLAFNQSAAFGPTDTAVLSRRAKILTMIQSSISLLIIVVLASRALS